MEPRTLIAACRFYCEEDILNPHNAMEDTQATYKVLKGQIKKYQGQVCRIPKQEEVFKSKMMLMFYLNYLWILVLWI